MDAAQHRRRDFLQNISIVLLTLSAVALFTQTQLYNLKDGSSGYLGGLLSSSPSALSSVASPAELRDLSAPVRVAITGAYGRYGNICLATTDDTFSLLRTLLGEALGSAKSFSPCGEDTFRSALSGNSVYYDFLEPLPLSILAGLAGEDASNADLTARRLVIFSRAGHVSLCIWDGQQGYLHSETAVSPSDLESTVNNYELTSASFAFDNIALDPGFQSVAPYSLFPAELPELSVLASVNALPDTVSLLTALGLNPHTNNRYTESSGTEVIMAGNGSLRIYTDGTVLYQGGDSAMKIKVSGEIPTSKEAAAWATSLINGLIGNSSGDASIFLQQIRQNGTTTVVQFGYHLDGVPIRFTDGSCAAEVTFSGSTVSTLQIRFRQYTRSGETSLLLPLRQVLAISSAHSGSELSIDYIDSGGSTVSAAWLAD